MMNLLRKTFRKPAPPERTAPPLTQWERAALADPGRQPTSELITAMERDSMVQTALTVKRLGVLAARSQVLGTDPQRVEFVNANLDALRGSMASVLDRSMDAFARGWSVQELIFELRDGRYWLAAVESRDADRFRPEIDAYGNLAGLRVRDGDAPLDARRFIIWRHRADARNPAGQSDLTAALPHYQAKTRLLTAWRRHLENHASPTMIGRIPRSVAPDEADAAFRALARLADSAAITLPSEIEVDSIPAERDASSGYIDAIDFHNREIARSILGQTLTTDEGRRLGSLAMGKVHMQVLLLQLAALRRQLADEVATEQVIRPLIELNFGPGGPIPRFEFDQTNLEAFAGGTL